MENKQTHLGHQKDSCSACGLPPRKTFEFTTCPFPTAIFQILFRANLHLLVTSSVLCYTILKIVPSSLKRIVVILCYTKNTKSSDHGRSVNSEKRTMFPLIKKKYFSNSSSLHSFHVCALIHTGRTPRSAAWKQLNQLVSAECFSTQTRGEWCARIDANQLDGTHAGSNCHMFVLSMTKDFREN